MMEFQPENVAAYFFNENGHEPRNMAQTITTE
jgi:hypothetical protein